MLLKNDGVLPLKTTGVKIAVGGSAGGSDEGAAGELQRNSDAYGFDS